MDYNIIKARPAALGAFCTCHACNANRNIPAPPNNRLRTGIMSHRQAGGCLFRHPCRQRAKRHGKVIFCRSTAARPSGKGHQQAVRKPIPLLERAASRHLYSDQNTGENRRDEVRS